MLLDSASIFSCLWHAFVQAAPPPIQSGRLRSGRSEDRWINMRQTPTYCEPGTNLLDAAVMTGVAGEECKDKQDSSLVSEIL